MKQGYYAFYWTFRVPWAGFTKLPKDVDEAAKASKTIRYSREVVRAHIRESGGILLPHGEMALMERSADHGTEWLASKFAALLDKAEMQGVKVAVADFRSHKNARGHKYLDDLYARPSCELVPVYYHQAHLTGMNPFDHFAGWSKQRRAHAAEKPEHRERILATLDAIVPQTYAARAAALNALGLRTHGGLEWTDENLRKFVEVDTS